MKTKFSIITICYNSQHEIEKTILSVIHQEQRILFEYIIIDGGSTDKTIEIIKSYKNNIDVVISEPDAGIYDAMNKGIKYAKGEWILFMNSGDTFANKDVLKTIAKEIEENKINSDIIYGNVIKQYVDKKIPFKAEKLSLLRYRMPFSHQSTLVKAELLKEELFDTRFKIAADYNFFHIAYLKKYSFYYLDIYISIFDAVSGVSSTSIWKSIKENALIIKQHKYKTFLIDYIINYLRGICITIKNKI